MQISRFCGYTQKFSPQIRGVVSFGTAKVSNPQRFPPRKSYFHQFAKVFSLKSFLLYGSTFTDSTSTVEQLHDVLGIVLQNATLPFRVLTATTTVSVLLCCFRRALYTEPNSPEMYRKVSVHLRQSSSVQDAINSLGALHVTKTN